MNFDIIRVNGRDNNPPPPVNRIKTFSLTAEKIPSTC